jgi:hypothetical protein
MKRLSSLLKFSSFLFLSSISAVTLADNPTAENVVLTKPVGGTILPGGQLYQPNFRSSFVFSKLIPFAIKYLIGLSAALAVLAIMFGGYQYMTAYGEPEQHKKATKTITWAVLGLILAITAYGIVALVTSIPFTATPNP